MVHADMFQLDKSSYKPRWVMLSFSFWINTGAFYCFDHPAALHNSLRDHFKDIIDADKFEIYFGGLYSVYAFANIFLPLISGQLRDIIGDRIVLIFMCVMLTLGQAIFCYGVILRSFFVMYFGRIILGWGIESCLPTQNSLVSAYFRHDYLALVASLNEFFANIGAILCMWYAPVIAQRYGLVAAIFSGVILNLFSLFCALIVNVFDKSAETQMIRQRDQDRGSYQRGNQQEPLEPLQQRSFWRSTFDFSVMNSYGPLFWYMATFMGIIYTSLLSLTNVSVGLLSERWLADDPNPEVTAGQMVGFTWLVTSILTPFFGCFIDRYGFRAIISIVVAVITAVSQVLVWYYHPLVGLLLLGMVFGLSYVTIWTGVLVFVNPKDYGKAFGCIIAMQQMGLTIVPMIVGILRSVYGTYYYSQMMLAILGVVAFVISILMYREDKRLNNRMDFFPENENNQHEFQFPQPENAEIQSIDDNNILLKDNLKLDSGANLENKDSAYKGPGENQNVNNENNLQTQFPNLI